MGKITYKNNPSWILVTILGATIFSVISVVAFNMEQTTTGFCFLAISVVLWLLVLGQLVQVYSMLVDMWLEKDRPIIGILWAMASALLSFILTPDKALDIKTCSIFVVLWFSLFFIPYYIYVKHGEQIWGKIKSFLGIKPKELTEEETAPIVMAQTSPKIASPLNAKMSQEEELKVINDMIAAIPDDLIKGLPQKLQVNKALYMLVLFREEGYLDNNFMPTITTVEKNGRSGINQTLYTYIANIISEALNIRMGKWAIFKEFWSLNNPAQLLKNLDYDTDKNSNEHQIRIGKMLRKATRLRPDIETEELRRIMNKH